MEQIYKEIIDLIKSSELNTYLKENHHALSLMDYAYIVVCAPISIDDKLNLLSRLPANEDNNICINHIKEYKDKLNNKEYVKLLEPIYYDYDDKDYQPLDGPFPVKDIEEARYLIDIYKYKEEDVLYWKLTLYNLNDKITEYGRREHFTYILNNEGTITYFDHYDFVPSLDIPVPYNVGDILKVDVRPYVKDVSYCVLTEVEEGCCGVWCAYLDKDNNTKTGAFKHGNFYDGSPFICESPLYNCEVIKKEELPLEQKPLLDVLDD